MGLIPNSAGYEIIEMKTKEMDPRHPNDFVLTLRSIQRNKWTGNMSVVDKEVNGYYQSRKKSIRLERDFIIDGQDFINLFASVYISSKRERIDFFSSYYLLKVPPNQKNAIYLEFFIDKSRADGFLDFAIKQAKSNKMVYDQAKSKLASESNLKTSKFGTASKIPG